MSVMYSPLCSLYYFKTLEPCQVLQPTLAYWHIISEVRLEGQRHNLVRAWLTRQGGLVRSEDVGLHF